MIEQVLRVSNDRLVRMVANGALSGIDFLSYWAFNEGLEGCLEGPITFNHPEFHRCRVCGCVDEDCSQCIEAQGYPFQWVNPDLCSRCFFDMVFNLPRGDKE